MLQRIFDWLVPVHPRVRESEQIRSLTAEERLEAVRANRFDNPDVPNIDPNRSSRAIKRDGWETSIGARAAEIVARDQELCQEEEWRELFKEFDQENAVRKQLNELLDKPLPELKLQESQEETIDWQPPARGFSVAGHCRQPYLQMVELKGPEPAQVLNQELQIKELQERSSQSDPLEENLRLVDFWAGEEVEEVSDSPSLEVNWDAVNNAAKNVSQEDAIRNAHLAANCGKDDVAEFWYGLANEIERETSDKHEQTD
jgi:hypothetical protein